MAETQFSICSRALVQLGERPISSFLASESDAAETCGTVYPSLKRGLMARYPWRFLMVKEELTRDSAVPIGEWSYSYIIPGASLAQPYAVFANSTDKTPINDFEIFGLRLYTSRERIFIDYMADKPESEWPGYFTELMVAAMCASIAFPVTDQQGVADSWRGIAFGAPGEGGLGGLMGDAMTQDAQASGNIGFQADVFVDARFGGGS